MARAIATARDKNFILKPNVQQNRLCVSDVAEILGPVISDLWIKMYGDSVDTSSLTRKILLFWGFALLFAAENPKPDQIAVLDY